jgi:heptosyltransferase I
VHILVIKPSSLGDVVHALPAVAAVRDANPDAEITWLINPEWAPLLRGNRDINHVHIFPRAEFRGLGGPIRMLPWLLRTRRLRPDVVLDFQGLLRSALIGRISGAKKLYGLSDSREGSRFLYSEVVNVNRTEHAVDRYLKLAEEFAGAANSMRFPIPTGDALPRFDPFPAFAVLHPYARGRGKSLSAGLIREFCRALHPTRVVVVGKSPRRRMEPPENCVNLTNQTTLLQLIWLLRNAAFIISVDSGPMHIAAALTTDLVSIHSWTDPRLVGPYNAAAWVWKNGRLYQVDELEEKTDFGKDRKFRREDVPAVAEIAMAKLAKQPSG